jgi:hypothetical protein
VCVCVSAGVCARVHMDISNEIFSAKAVSRREGFLMFKALTPSQSSACAGGLVAPKQINSCPTVRCVYLCLVGCRMDCDPSG